MPPKTSKKTADKAKAKTIDDKTFGLKNKNRSSKVQAYVNTVTKTVKAGNPNDKKRAAENEQKNAKKNAKKDFEAEMAKLFNDVDGGKKKVEEKKPEEEEENGVYDPDAYLWRAEDFDDVQEDDTRLEEKLEAEREALKGRTDLTPVTEETFQAWKAQKRKEAAEAEKARKQKAKKAGKIKGYDLWEENKDLFVDDDEAEELYEREEEEEGDYDFGEDEGEETKHVDPNA